MMREGQQMTLLLRINIIIVLLLAQDTFEKDASGNVRRRAGDEFQADKYRTISSRSRKWNESNVYVCSNLVVVSLISRLL